MIRGKFRLPVDHGEVARDWQERGFGCDPFEDPPGREWRDYVHDTNELVTVVEGELTVSMHGSHYVIAPGDELFIPKHTTHSVRNTSERETRWLYGYD